MKHESCGFFCFLFLLIFPCLFFPTLFAESRMQRRYLHVATWIIRFFWSRPESAFFKVFPGHSWILQWNPDTMNQSLAQLCCKKHPRLSPGLRGTSCSSLAGNIPATWLYLLGHLVGTWKSFLKKKISFICLLFSLAFISVALTCTFTPSWSLNNSASLLLKCKPAHELAFYRRKDGRAHGGPSGKALKGLWGSEIRRY